MQVTPTLNLSAVAALPPLTLLANGILATLSPEKDRPLLTALQALPNISAGLRFFTACLCKHYSLPHESVSLTEQMQSLSDVWTTTAVNVLNYFALAPEAAGAQLPRYIQAAAKSFATRTITTIAGNTPLEQQAAFIGASPARLRTLILFSATSKLSEVSYTDVAAIITKTIVSEWTCIAEYLNATVNAHRNLIFEPVNLGELREILATNVVSI